MKRLILFLSFLLLFPINAWAVRHKGDFSLIYKPTGYAEGFPILIKGRWMVGTFVKEPIQNIDFTWQFYEADSDGVWVNFVPYGRA